MTKISTSGGWPEWMDQTEAKICNRLITAIFTRDYKIRVRDCEMCDIQYPTTSKRKMIQAHTAQTGATLYDVMHQLEGGREVRIGTFMLIHGNHDDVISDYNWHPQVPEAEALMEAFFEEATR